MPGDRHGRLPNGIGIGIGIGGACQLAQADSVLRHEVPRQFLKSGVLEEQGLGQIVEVPLEFGVERGDDERVDAVPVEWHPQIELRRVEFGLLGEERAQEGPRPLGQVRLGQLRPGRSPGSGRLLLVRGAYGGGLEGRRDAVRLPVADEDRAAVLAQRLVERRQALGRGHRDQAEAVPQRLDGVLVLAHPAVQPERPGEGQGAARAPAGRHHGPRRSAKASRNALA